MGIVNATPDSFSDGGEFLDVEVAVQHALQMAKDGASIIDVGGESTRPYSTAVPVEEEIRRVVPVIESIGAASDVPVSIDTSKAAVAIAAINAGAEIVNDVTGLTGDPAMIDVAVANQVGVCAMHMQGRPQTMQDDPVYDDVVGEIHEYLRRRKDALLEAGVDGQRICLDPGIGFGKTHEHNLELLANAERFLTLGCPILIGHSRKGFIGKLLGDQETNRDSGTLAISLLMAQKRIQVLRVHEVKETVKALKVFAGAGGLA
ncbi:UNVERIFIED_CONTAM: hypothetical protein GTU68_037282 [Idotea baltica]|nr:hypothetical protein [Idotea baltica]